MNSRLHAVFPDLVLQLILLQFAAEHVVTRLVCHDLCKIADSMVTSSKITPTSVIDAIKYTSKLIFINTLKIDAILLIQSVLLITAEPKAPALSYLDIFNTTLDRYNDTHFINMIKLITLQLSECVICSSFCTAFFPTIHNNSVLVNLTIGNMRFWNDSEYCLFTTAITALVLHNKCLKKLSLAFQPVFVSTWNNQVLGLTDAFANNTSIIELQLGSHIPLGIRDAMAAGTFHFTKLSFFKCSAREASKIITGAAAVAKLVSLSIIDTTFPEAASAFISLADAISYSDTLTSLISKSITNVSLNTISFRRLSSINISEFSASPADVALFINSLNLIRSLSIGGNYLIRQARDFTDQVFDVATALEKLLMSSSSLWHLHIGQLFLGTHSIRVAAGLENNTLLKTLSIHNNLLLKKDPFPLAGFSIALKKNTFLQSFIIIDPPNNSKLLNSIRRTF
jgi:hypothetical protein